MTKILSKSIKIWDFEAGERVTLEAGTELPEWAEDRVTNPKLFVSDVEGVSNSSSDDESFEGSLENMTVNQLRDLADEEGVDLSGVSRKADIIEAIESHRADNE